MSDRHKHIIIHCEHCGNRMNFDSKLKLGDGYFLYTCDSDAAVHVAHPATLVSVFDDSDLSGYLTQEEIERDLADELIQKITDEKNRKEYSK